MFFSFFFFLIKKYIQELNSLSAFEGRQRQKSHYYVEVQIWIALFKAWVGVSYIMPVIQSCLPIRTDGTTRHNIRKLTWNDKKKKKKKILLKQTNFICNLFKSGISSLWLKGIWRTHSTDNTARLERSELWLG